MVINKLFRIITLVAPILLFSQEPPPPPPIELDIQSTTTGYYTCYIDGVFVDNHTSMSKADAHCTEISYNRPDAIVGFKHPEFTLIKVKNQPKTIEVDTIQVIRVKDLKGWIDHTGENTIAYLPFYNNGVIDFATDSVYNWQSKYNFKRTKTFGKISYENLNIPFQFMDIWSTDGDKLWFNITQKQIRITAWIDDVLFKEFNPGTSNEIENGFEFYFYVPNTGYIKVEVENEVNEIITYKTTLKL